jgi:site-specific recombinase XerC
VAVSKAAPVPAARATACRAGSGDDRSALLRVSSGRSFEDRRDHAIIRVLLIGVRREEVARLQVEHLDLRSLYRSAAVIGLKGSMGRRVPLDDRDVLALRRWLGVRSYSGA